MEEIWRPIYEGKYEVSNLGNVKSFARYKDGKLMKPSIRKDGYLEVHLSNNGSKLCLVHRLVLQAFLPIDDKEVNHKNHDKSDNRLENLEWCSSSENSRFRKKWEGCSSQYKGVCWHKNKWISRCRIDGNLFHIGCFDDEQDAGKAYNDFVIKHNLQQFTILNSI
jgi:hypothetical protein